MTRLPPFDALIAFETTARLGSMTRAASELFLTQSAISHRIRRLEVFMGVQLFDRSDSGLIPTAAGRAVLDGMPVVLDGLAELRIRCLAAAAPNRIRVGVGAALADNWLVQRLPQFAAQNPNLTVELSVVENEAPERAADLDIRILWVTATAVHESAIQRPLFQERVFPVCSPSLLPRDFEAGDPSVLLELPLLHKGTRGHAAAAEWNWDAWFTRLGLPGRPKEALRFDSIGPAISAALTGAGVALARSMLVHDALKEKRLIRVLPKIEDQLSSKVHVARWSRKASADVAVQAFASWLAAKSKECGL
jgi:LysR family transcriptional regulator, glycine cleavage system transcriptional activator